MARTTRQAAQATVMVDNATVIVTEWRFAPGSETGWHRHSYDYVVVPQSTGNLLLEGAGADTTAQLDAGQPYFRSAGVEHNVVNVNDHEFVFIEVEIKK
jgi:quercetin dioxygenase-like cupin family protein